MNRARENNLWAWLRDGVPSGMHIQRVENCVAEGTLDVEGAWLGRQFWLELKSVPRRREIFCELKPTQAQFMRRRVDVGCAAYILIQVGVGVTATRYLVHGVHAYELLSSITEERLQEIMVSICMTPQAVFEGIYGPKN